MKTNIKVTIAAFAVLNLTAMPTAHAQFGSGDIIKSVKKEVSKTTKSEDKENPASSLSEANENYNKKYKNYQKTITQGAGFGAIAGGIAGYALGGSTEAVAIGAGVGALAGGAIGKQVADESDSVVKSRKKLNKKLKAAQKYRESTLEILEETKLEITRLENEIQSLKNDYLTTKISESELAQKLVGVEKFRENIKTNLTNHLQTVELKEATLKEIAIKAAASSEVDIREKAPEVQSEQHALGGVKTVVLVEQGRMHTLDSKIVSVKGLIQ